MVRTAPLGEAACTLSGAPWLPEDEEAALSFGPEGPAFVHVTDGAAEVEVPVGPAGHVFVRMSGAGWHLAGHLSAARLSVRPLTVTIHDGVLLPTEFAKLDLVRAERGRLWLVARPPPVVRLLAPAEPEAYSCDDVNLGPPPLLDAEGELLGDETTRRTVRIPAGEIPLSRKPGSAPSAWLELAEPFTEAIEFARQSGHRRIALTRYTTLVFGWVPASALRAPPAPEMAYGEGGLGMTGILRGLAEEEATPPELRHCPTVVPLFARVGSEVMQVGTIDPETPLAVTEVEGAARIEAPRWLKLAAGASFETPAEALAECTPP